MARNNDLRDSAFAAIKSREVRELRVCSGDRERGTAKRIRRLIVLRVGGRFGDGRKVGQRRGGILLFRDDSKGCGWRLDSTLALREIESAVQPERGAALAAHAPSSSHKRRHDEQNGDEDENCGLNSSHRSARHAQRHNSVSAEYFSVDEVLVQRDPAFISM